MRPEQLTPKPRPPVSRSGTLTNVANRLENIAPRPRGVCARAHSSVHALDVSETAIAPPLSAAVGSVKPGRVRNRTKTEPEQKIKKPADGVQKKTPPARKAPARGRYVDEYARPAN